MSPLAATLVEEKGTARIRRLRVTPGAFYWLSDGGQPAMSIVFSCPCGCGNISSTFTDESMVRRRGSLASVLKNIGTLETPTLDGEIVIMPMEHPEHPDAATANAGDGAHWRGRLVDGAWRESNAT